MGFFDDLMAAIGVGPTELEDRTSEDKLGVSKVKPKMKPKGLSDHLDIITGDLAYGLNISEDKPYGYDQRSAASLERGKAELERLFNENNNEQPKGPAPSPDADTADGAAEVAVPGANEQLKGTAPEGSTEAAAMKAGKKGRKSTILTGPQGLLADPDTTRPRRSLMGLIR